MKDILEIVALLLVVAIVMMFVMADIFEMLALVTEAMCDNHAAWRAAWCMGLVVALRQLFRKAHSSFCLLVIAQ